MTRMLSYLLTDAKVMGILAWVGLLTTFVGFAVALVQLAKIKSASRAAAAAIAGLSRRVRLQEQSVKVSEALGHMMDAQKMMRGNNASAASAHLSVGWTMLLTARELCESESDREKIGHYIFVVKRLLDDINHPLVQTPPPDKLLLRRHRDISRAVSGLGEFSARLDVSLLGLEADHE